jgi:hypothetical protein
MVDVKRNHDAETMTFKDWRDVMIAMGINLDKIRPPEAGGINFNINDMRTHNIYTAVVRRDEPTPIELTGEVVPDDDSIDPAEGRDSGLPTPRPSVGPPGSPGDIPSE